MELLVDILLFFTTKELKIRLFSRLGFRDITDTAAIRLLALSEELLRQGARHSLASLQLIRLELELAHGAVDACALLRRVRWKVSVRIWRHAAAMVCACLPPLLTGGGGVTRC